MDIVYLTIAWALGSLVAHSLTLNLPYGPISVGLAMVFALIWPSTRRRVRFPLVCLLLFTLGAWRLSASQPKLTPNHIAHFNELEAVTVEGIVINEPDIRDTGIAVQLKAEYAQALGQRHTVTGKVLVNLPRDTQIAYGDRLLVMGDLREPPTVDGFDYRAWLARQGTLSYMRTHTVVVLNHDEGLAWRAWLLNTRAHARTLIESTLAEPQASLLIGILLGDETGLARDTKEAFTITGTSHVIAISGFNMTILAGVVAGLFGGTTTTARRRGYLPTLVIISLYTLFVGASPSVIRAAIMSIVLITAPLLKRRTFVPASLGFAALLMAVLNPWVWWDVGFQLSLASVLGMALLTPSLDRRFQKCLQQGLGETIGKPIGGWLSEPLVVSFTAQMFTLPIVLYHFERLSLVSLIVNLLIIPAQPPILLLGGLATLIGFIWAVPAYWLYQATWLFLLWTTTTVHQFAMLPLASVEVGFPSWLLWSLVVMAIASTVLHAKRPPWFERFWQAPTLALIVIPLLGLVLLASLTQRIIRQPDDNLHVWYLDMGQSNSALIRTPDGAVILIDGGRYPSRLLATLGEKLARREIDVLIVTNDSADDIGALAEIAKRYRIQTVVVAFQHSNESAYQNLLTALGEQDTHLLLAADNWQFQTADGVVLEVLSPSFVETRPTAMVMRLTYKDATFLFTNDPLAPTDEQLLMQNWHQVQATIYQAAGHAADKTNSAAWVAAVNPQVVIVQVDAGHWEGGAIGHVMARFEDRHLYRTDQHGTIEVFTDGAKLHIRTTKG